jgi:hypothetical protein
MRSSSFDHTCSRRYLLSRLASMLTSVFCPRASLFVGCRDQKVLDEKARKQRDLLSAKHNQLKQQRAALEKSVSECTEAVDALEGKMRDLEDERIHRVRQLEKERSTLAAQQTALSKCRPEAAMHADAEKAQQERTRLRNTDMAYERSMRELDTQIAEVLNQKRHAESRLARIQAKNVKDTPMTRLERLDRNRGPRASIDRDQALIARVRADGKLTGRVLGPLLGVLRVDHPLAASYVEELIPAKWATAWIVENQEDHTVLHNAGVKGSIITARAEANPRPRPYNLEPLRKFDVHWVDEQIQADPLVLIALRDVLAFHLHVFSDRVLKPDEQHQLLSTKKGDNMIQSLFTGSQHYSTMTSTWSNDVAVASSAVRKARILGGPVVDEGADREKQEAERAIADADAQMKALVNEKNARSNAWEAGHHERMQKMEHAKAVADQMAREMQHRKQIVISITRAQEKIRSLEAPEQYEKQKESDNDTRTRCEDSGSCFGFSFLVLCMCACPVPSCESNNRTS